MGLVQGRDMSGRNDDDSLSDGSDNESELSLVLQYLINSGQVRILGDQSYIGSYPRPPRTIGSNLDNFHKSELCYYTKRASGAYKLGRNRSITHLINKRQYGQLKGGCGFSLAERRAVSNQKLPVHRTTVDTYESKAFCGLYNQDGTRLITACQDRYLRLYDCADGSGFKEIKQILGRDVGWSILDAAFSPDSRSIAYSSWSTSLNLVSLDKDQTTHTSLPLCPEVRRFCIFSLRFSSQGNEILCGANEGHIYIYDLTENRRTLRIEAHDDDVNTVAFADDASHIIYSGGDDGLCKVWDRRTMNECSPKPVGILAGHLDGVIFIDSRGDGRHFISNSKDQSIKLWDIRYFSNEAAQESTKKAVRTSRWDYRWQSAPRKLMTRKKNIKGDTSLATYRGHSVLQTQLRCRFSPAFTTGQRYIYTGCAFGQVIVYDILTGAMVLKLKGHSSCVRDISWHPYRPEIVSTSWDFSVLCWNHYGDCTNAEDRSDEELDECCRKVHASTDPDDTNPAGLRRSKRIADRASSTSQ